ncbi:steroid 17-alpha-hydroxylase/17,20 lyase [Aplysia californica]|uniref:Steroid 17-alpha-hydroxylase/17,20 lyase n=1 Tax=Aplysia californica TaxID=6500 RepID=A0ABM0ZVB2_APLCA|nr:steroid 17-alpha-hydroxylase/17,20 lyase [Aplysia californica]
MSTSVIDSLEITPVLLVSALALVAGLVYRYLTTYPANLPPGPRGWDCFKQLMEACNKCTLKEKMWSWAEQYGDLVFYYSLGAPFCVLNSAKVTRLLLADDKYKLLTADREPNFFAKNFWYNGKDFFFTKYDDITKRKRRFFHKALGMFGDGVLRFEDVVGGELDKFMAGLGQKENVDFHMDIDLARSLIKIIYILLIGENTDDDTADQLEEYDMATNDLSNIDNQTILTYLPFMRHFGKFKAMCDRASTTRKITEEKTFYHVRKTYVPGEIRGIVDIFLQQANEPGYEFLKDDEHAKAMLSNIFVAAHTTTRSSLLSSFLLMCHYPEVMRNIQEEIDRVLGDRQPRVEDRKDMHYTEAFILEMQRYISQLPLGFLRLVKEDIPLNGYVIPKGTTLLVNNWYFQRDSTFFEDPWEVKPERFLDAKGQLLHADHEARKRLLTFGVGPRFCPGEVFARSRVFLFLSRILKVYDILPPEKEGLPSCDPRTFDTVLILQPPQFKCRVRPRTNKTVS